jgi:hypothetical protein
MTKTQTTKLPETPFAVDLPWPCHYFPRRERVWESVSDEERQKAAELIARYRANEEICRLNDLNGFGWTIAALEREGNFIDAEQVRLARGKADNAKFLQAQAELYQLREKAADLVVPILARLRDEFAEELNAVALQKESGMVRLGIPLSVEDRRGMNLVTINGQEPQWPRSWKLHNDEEIRALHSFREVAANLLSMFKDGWRNYTANEIRQERGIPTLQHLCTRDACNFNWA